MKRTRPVLAVLALLVAVPAAALTIDDFEAGPFEVVDTPLINGWGEQSGLATANVIGGVRHVSVQALGRTTTATASLSTTAGDDATTLTVVGDPVDADGMFRITYDGIANGIEDGTSGALGLDLSAFNWIEIEATLTAPASARITLFTATAFGYSSVLLENGRNLISLSSGTLAGIPLSSIQSIDLRISGSNTGDTVTVSNLSAEVVPEPGTGVLIAIGCAGLALRRRAQR